MAPTKAVVLLKFPNMIRNIVEIEACGIFYCLDYVSRPGNSHNLPSTELDVTPGPR